MKQPDKIKTTFKYKVLKAFRMAIFIGLVGAIFPLGLLEFKLSETKMIQDFETLGNIFGNRSIAALVFKDIQAANKNLSAARFEEDYRRAVIRKLDELELFGVDAPATSRRHRLSIAYITLSVEPPSGILGSTAAASRATAGDDDPQPETNPIPIEIVLGGTRVAVEIGLS